MLSSQLKLNMAARVLSDSAYGWREAHADIEAGKIIGNYGGNHVRHTSAFSVL